MSQRVILAVDPGKATGIAAFSYTLGEEPVLLGSGEYDNLNFGRPIVETIGTALAQNAEIDIVCERFIINAQTVRNSQAPFSLEQIGALKFIAYDTFGIHPDKILFQSPSDAKKMFPNDALKKLGYWHKGGEGHALDAVRHGLLRLVKTGWKPMKLLE